MKNLTTLEFTTLDHVIGGCKLVAQPSQPAPKAFDAGSYTALASDFGFGAPPELERGIQAIDDRVSGMVAAVDQHFNSADLDTETNVHHRSELDTNDIDTTELDAGDATGLPDNWCGTPSGSGSWDDGDDLTAEADDQPLAVPEQAHMLDPIAISQVAEQVSAPTVHETRDHRAPMEAVISDHRSSPIVSDHRA